MFNLKKSTINNVIVVVILAFSLLINQTFANNKVFNIYTYSSFDKYGPAKDIKKLFEEQCNCEVKFTLLDGQVGLLNKIKLEDKYTKADVVIGIDSIQNKDAINYFQSSGYDIKKLNVPFDLANDILLPIDYSPIGVVYNVKKVSKVPTTFKEFVDSDISFIYADPRSNNLGKYLLALVDNAYPNEKDAAIAWKKIAAKTITIAKGWSASYGAFTKGESASAMGYESSLIYHKLVDKDDSFAFIKFEDGNYISYESVAISKYSKDVDLSKQFVDFILSEKIQKIIAIKNSGIPVKFIDNDFINQLGKVKVLYIDVSKQEKLIQNWLKYISK